MTPRRGRRPSGPAPAVRTEASLAVGVPGEPAAGDRDLWTRFRTELKRQTGNVAPLRSAAVGLEGLRQLADSFQLTPDAFLTQVHDQAGPERRALIDRMTTRTTWFGRELAAIADLAAALGRRARAEGSPRVRLWCVGCATGQEPYTLAMALLEERLAPEILATDVSHAALHVARAARYPDKATAGVSASWQRLYFEPDRPGHVRVHPAVVKCVTFAVHNLAEGQDPPPGWLDLDAVLCRNVLIYFDLGEGIRIAGALAAACRPGGQILLGAVEELLLQPAPVPPAEPTPRPVRAPVHRPGAPVHPPATHTAQARAAKHHPAARAPAPDPEVATVLDPDRLLKMAEPHDALRILDATVAGEPLLAPAHLLRGLVLKRIGRADEAAQCFRRARFLTHDDAWLAPYQLGLTLETLGDGVGAAEAYRHALATIDKGGRAGMPFGDGSEDALARSVRRACQTRLEALAPRPKSRRPRAD